MNLMLMLMLMEKPLRMHKIILKKRIAGIICHLKSMMSRSQKMTWTMMNIRLLHSYTLLLLNFHCFGSFKPWLRPKPGQSQAKAMAGGLA
jgi:hypothetical protein